MQELCFSHSARNLILIDIYKKFRKDSLYGFQIIQQAQFCEKVPREITP